MFFRVLLVSFGLFRLGAARAPLKLLYVSLKILLIYAVINILRNL